MHVTEEKNQKVPPMVPKKSIKVVNELKRKKKKKKGKTYKPYEAWIDTGRERKQVLWYFVME